MKITYTEKYKKLISLLVIERKNAGMTQEVLSKKLDRPQSFVSKIENGERRMDVIEFLEITKHIGVDAGEIIKKIEM